MMNDYCDDDDENEKIEDKKIIEKIKGIYIITGRKNKRSESIDTDNEHYIRAVIDWCLIIIDLFLMIYLIINIITLKKED